ncbi:MAG TPA: Ig-like domain repeat protein [Casimicrobiaceae bacterium]|nr:Ig-like domain repeat protein [Casimicrobiaceae bacterium]
MSGATQCWGFNGDGELGDGTTTSSDTPVAVSGLAAGAIALAVGAYVSCAVVAGGAKCWGANNSGQLGYGVSVRQSMPGDVIGVASGVSAMAGGWTHTCAVVGPGAAKCWGNNQWGQLGDGTLSSATVPVDVVGLGSGVSQVSAAYYHTCAIVNGGAQCWGSGLFGALGDGTTNDSATPVPVTGLGSGVTAIAAGVDHTCAAVGGAAKCWGFNDTGQLGNGTTTMSSQPVDVIGLGSGVTSISAGVHHSCAVANGAVKCWGQNVNGELGNGTVVSSTTSVGVTGLSSGATVVAVGDGHSCAIVYGAIKCWGYNPYGELGNGTTVTSLLPVDVAGIGSGATSLAAGRFHSCAIVSGAARCWGDNTASQIGDGTNVNALTPAEPIGLFSGVTVVAAGTNQSCAAVFGAAKCWGFGPAGELGNGVRTFSTVPVTVLNSPPTVTTAGASAVAANGATLNALVNSNSAASNASFAYGLTTAYGYFVVAVENPLAPNANSATASATIIGLACNTTYHFRAIATNANGIGNGGDVIFTTAPCANTTVTTTFLVSDINPIADQTRITYTATVTGTSPTGTVAFSDNGTDIPGCGAIPLAGSGNARPVACATTAFVGTHAIAARYSGDATNSPSLSIPLDEQVFAASPIMGSIVTNPYGPLSVSGGMLNGSLFSLAAPHASIQLGTGPGSSGAYVEIDFDSLHISGTTTFTIYSGAPGQVVVLRVTGMTPSALGGTLQAQGGNGAPPPELHLWNPNGFTVATPAKVIAPSGITLDALGASWNIGKDVVNAGLVDGGVTLALMGAGIHGGGAFRGDAIRLHTFGNANNPANGAHYLSNSLQLFPSSGTDALLTINDYGVNPQFLNLKVNGNASISMPSLWPAGMALPANNAPVPAGGMRPAGVPEPTYGGGSIILQATGTVTLLGGASNDLAFPGGIVLLSGSTLNLAGVSVNQGWTAAGKAFQGLYFESPDIISGSTVSILSNDLNWTNFSSMPAGHFHISRLTQMPDGTLGYSAADSTAPHLNRYSQLIDAAANGQCWTCLINYTPIDVQ